MNSSVSPRLNADLLDAKYAQWCEDPRSVEPTWSAFFEGFELGAAQAKRREETAAAAPATATPGAASDADLAFYGKVVSLVYNFRTLGHTQAHINPLEDTPEKNPRLRLDQFGFSDADIEREASTQWFRHGDK